MARYPRTAPIPAWMFLGASYADFRAHDAVAPVAPRRRFSLFGLLRRKA